MKANLFLIAIAASLIVLTAAPTRADDTNSVDIKRAVPPDAFVAIYARQNPARDYQREYFADAWKSVQDEHIGERLLTILTSRMPEEKLAAVKSRWEEVQTALAPINGHALVNADEFVLAEVMEVPINHLLVAVRLKPDEAADCERGLKQACELITRWTEGKAAVETRQVKDASVTALVLPKESPYQPAVARLNNIVLISTNASLLRRSVEQLQDSSAKSKFDDPRLQEALTHLPKPDDALVFFDGRKLFESLHGLGAFIRGHAKNDPQAARIARIIDRVIDEIAILDYEVTVEYTDPGQNRTVAFGKLADDFSSKLAGQALAQRKPLDNWQSWVPKHATAYSVSAGVNLHELYDGIIKLVREEFPEAQNGLDKFADLQEKVGVNLDRDLLQSFTGESVAVTVPVKAGDGSIRQESVTALKCTNPDKIRELLTRAVDSLNKIPALQMQQIKLVDCTDLNGFQQLSAAVFQMLGAQPVIGFRDGWMIVASNRKAAEQVLAVCAGQAESIDRASFEKFGLDPQGVYRVRFRDIGAEVQHAADMLDKIGAVAPMFLSMAAANAKPEELKPMQEAIGLLPSVAKVVRKFDFYGHSLTLTRQGPMPGTYLRESVTEVRLPK